MEKARSGEGSAGGSEHAGGGARRDVGCRRVTSRCQPDKRSPRFISAQIRPERATARFERQSHRRRSGRATCLGRGSPRRAAPRRRRAARRFRASTSATHRAGRQRCLPVRRRARGGRLHPSASGRNRPALWGLAPRDCNRRRGLPRPTRAAPGRCRADARRSHGWFAAVPSGGIGARLLDIDLAPSRVDAGRPLAA